MAPHKRKAESYDKSDPFVASDDETSTTRPSKKPKSTTTASQSAPDLQKDEEGNAYWEISKSRRVTISTFKGKQMVSIREYYEKDGKSLPGKKGITMTIEQYSTFLTIIPQIEDSLSRKGETVPRPQFGGGPVRSNNDDDDDDDEEEENGSEVKKENYEATSDEDGD